MSLNFGQFATPTFPIASTDKLVGYQLVGAGLIPTCTQYTFAQVATYVGGLTLTPAILGPAVLAWFNTLPTVLPAATGILWNNGGTLAQS